MASSDYNISKIYSIYCDITSTGGHACSRDMLKMLSKSLESIELARDDVLGHLSKLMHTLNLSVDSSKFNCFYGFVYFICRENGQKNISVNTAITAWKLVLSGRFRLLDQWCNFLKEHHKHNISEDTWHQVLAFGQCVNENLEGYDPKDAWPVLIDDFVHYMYSIDESSECYNFGGMESHEIINIYSGLKLQPGFKRKCDIDTGVRCEATPITLDNDSIHLKLSTVTKRVRHSLSLKNVNVLKHLGQLTP